MIRTSAILTVLIAVVVLSLEKPLTVLATCNTADFGSGMTTCECDSTEQDNCVENSHFSVTSFLLFEDNCNVDMDIDWFCKPGHAATLYVNGSAYSGSACSPDCSSDSWLLHGLVVGPACDFGAYDIELRLDANCDSCNTAELRILYYQEVDCLDNNP